MSIDDHAAAPTAVRPPGTARAGALAVLVDPERDRPPSVPTS